MTNWKKHEQENEATIWAGTSSILNMKNSHTTGETTATYALCAFFGIIGLLLFATGGVGAVVAVTILFPTAIIAFIMKKNMGPQWINHDWILIKDNNIWQYSRKDENRKNVETWTIENDKIAQIEAGLTKDWTPSRNYFGKSKAVSAYEYQVFIITSSQERLVIHTQNAAREDCATLAKSIRDHLENGRAPRAATASRGSGFDL